MTKKILLLGRTTIALDDTQQQLERADIQLFAGTSIEDIRAVFAQANIGHVIMGGRDRVGNPPGDGASNLSGKRHDDRPYERIMPRDYKASCPLCGQSCAD